MAQNNKPEVFNKFIENFINFFHASNESNEEIIKVRWNIHDDQLPIEMEFDFDGYDTNDCVRIKMSMFENCLYDRTFVVEFTILIDPDGNTEFKQGSFDDFQVLEFLNAIGAITLEAYYEAHLILSLIGLTNADFHLDMRKMNEAIVANSSNEGNEDEEDEEGLITGFIRLFAITGDHPEIFKDLDEETRNKMIDICVAEDREDCVVILRQNK